MANPVFNRVRDRLFARDAISTNSDTRSTSLTLSPGTVCSGVFFGLESSHSGGVAGDGPECPSKLGW